MMYLKSKELKNIPNIQELRSRVGNQEQKEITITVSEKTKIYDLKKDNGNDIKFNSN